MSVSNKMQVGVLKNTYLNQIGDKDVLLENIRIFCLGKELKNDLFLYSYEVKD